MSLLDEGKVAFESGVTARRQKRPDEARAAFARASSAFRAADSPADLSRALSMQAQIERDEGQLDAAIAFQSEALGIERPIGDPACLGHVVRHMGDLLRVCGRYDEAGPYYDEMLALYGSAGDVPPLEMANALRSVALHRELTGDRNGAHKLWMDVRERYIALDGLIRSMTGGDNPAVAEVSRRIAALEA